MWTLARGKSAALIAFCATVLFASTSVGRSREPRTRFDREIYSILFSEEKTSDEAAADLVVELGDRAISSAVAILSGRSADEWSAWTRRRREESQGNWPPKHFRPGEITRRQEAVLLLALAEFPEKEVAGALSEAFRAGTIYELRIAFKIIGEVGGLHALETWIELAEGIDPVHLRREFVRRQLLDSLAALLRRDRRVAKELSRRVYDLDQHLWSTVVRAAGDTQRPEVIEMLVTLLGRQAELDPLILSQVSAYADDRGLDDEQASWIRPFLHDKQWQVRRSAATTLGSAGDFESMGRIIELLEDEHAAVRSAAQWSLERLSGLEWANDRASWQTYFEREDQWFRSAGSEFVLDLGSGDEAKLFAAIRELSARPIFRHAFSQELTRVLSDSRPEIVRTGCLALARLGSQRACNDLVELLLTPDESIRNAAWAALKEITGKDLDLDHDVWRAEFPR